MLLQLPGKFRKGGWSDKVNYYISDLHLFHQQCIVFDERPFADIDEMNAAILRNWNGRVTNADTVYILGDIALRTNAEEVENLVALVSRLKGRKILVKGNHDDVSDYRYKQLFTEVCDYKEVTDNYKGKAVKLVLCHYPILNWKRQRGGTVLLYGHTHASPEDDYFQYCLSGMKDYGLIRESDKKVQAYNVGCMQPYMNYTPRTLAEIMDAGQTECRQEPERKDIPYYSDFEKCWKVTTEYGEEKGDLCWCVSEFIKDNLLYQYSDGDHGHGFEDVLKKILENPDCEDIEGDRGQYSAQELAMMDKLRAKLQSKLK